MKKLNFSILIIFLFLLIIFSPIKANAATGVMIGNIENASLGSYVRLAGMTWRLIGDNYIVLNEPSSFRAYGKNNNVSYASSDIRVYLNNDFLNKLGSAERLISNTDWTIGTETFEEKTIVNDKISLPSYSDMDVIKSIIGNGNNNIWTRTQVDSSKAMYKFWCLNTKNSSLIQKHYTDKSDVYPVLTIAPNVVITGKGTERNPYVVSEMPGQEDKTRITGVRLDSSNINIKIKESYSLTTLFIYGDGSLKQIVNPDKYLYDKSLSSRSIPSKYEVLVTGDKIKYFSSNTDVAEVSKMGYVVGKKTGVAVITIKGVGWVTKGVVIVK